MPRLILVLQLVALLFVPGLAGAVSNFGEASERIAMPVPDGPSGMQPELALLYSSGAGNGNAGVGWGLPYSSVRLNLLDGVPLWSLPSAYGCGPAWEGRVQLDGAEMVPSPGDPIWDPGDGSCVWRTRPDEFLAAIPFWRGGSGPGTTIRDADDQPAGWAIIRPDGRVWWYGDHPSTSEADSAGYRRVAPPSGPAGVEIVTEWFLHHVQDRDGNLVTYRPEWDFGDPSDPAALAGVPDVRLRAVSWAERVPGASFAWDPLGDSITGFSTGAPYGVQGTADWLGAIDSSAFLRDPGAFFPSAPGTSPEGSGPHYYAALVEYATRPDVRVTHRAGVPVAQRGRIEAVTVFADAEVDFQPGTTFGLRPGTSPDALRSWALQYDEGTTGKSRLTRVWPLVGAASLPQSAPTSGRGAWDPTDPTALQNPWEIAWSDSSTLDPSVLEVPDAPGGSELDVSPDPADPFWFQEGFIDGGFNLTALMDLNGDGLPDQVEHAPELLTIGEYGQTVPYENSPVFDNLGAIEFYVDHVPPLLSDEFLHVRWNEGGAWSAQELGPLDPFALYATADVQVVTPGCADPDPTSCGLPVGPLAQPISEGVGAFCEAASVNVLYDTGMPPFEPGAPFPAIRAELDARMAWCEYRSCAPFCEPGSAVTSPYNALSAAAGGALGATVDLETVRPEQGDPRSVAQTADGLVDEDELLLWEKYAVTLFAANSTADRPNIGMSTAAPGTEPESIVRHVDGYARPSFTTRVADGLIEMQRNVDFLGKDLDPDAGYLVETGLVHDLIDMNGDGYPDRVLGGAGILSNRATAQAALPNPDPGAPKGFAYSTEHMSWMVALFDPQSGEFAAPVPWDLPYSLPFTPADVEYWYEAPHYSWLGVWESTDYHGGAAPSSSAGVSAGPSGVSAGAAASFGPVGASVGASAGGLGASVSLGPLSLSTSGLSIGPMSYSGGSWSVSAGAVAMTIINEILGVLDAFDVPHALGGSFDHTGASVSLPGVGDICGLNCPEHTRYQKAGLFDLNGDRRPDYVRAQRGGTWEVFLANECPLGRDVDNDNAPDCFDPPVIWGGIATAYINWTITSVYSAQTATPSLDAPSNADPLMRVANQVAGLQDMNGDGLPDFVYVASPAAGDPLVPPMAAVGTDNEPTIDVHLAGHNLFVKLNTGAGFAGAVPWFDAATAASLADAWGHIPALASSRVFTSWEAQGNNASLGIHGLQDWNADGLVDYYAMTPHHPYGFPLPTPLAAVELDFEERAPTIFLNRGTGFASGALAEASRYGSFTLDTDALGQSQTGPHGLDPTVTMSAAAFSSAYPSYATSLWFRVDPDEESVGTVSQSMFMDIDGNGTLDWVVNGARDEARAFPLQDAVPDLMTTFRAPPGEAVAYEYEPARDHMDVGVDAYPCGSQVVAQRREVDPVTGRDEVQTFAYAAPAFDPDLQRSFGFGEIVVAQGDQERRRLHFNDWMRAGLMHTEEVLDGGGALLQRTDVDWDATDFAALHAHLGGAADTWAWAARRTTLTTFDPAVAQASPALPGFAPAGFVQSDRYTFHTDYNGLPWCAQEDADADGDIDRMETLEFDPTLGFDGFVSAVSEERTYVPGPAAVLPGMCVYDSGSWGWEHQVRRVFHPTGKADRVDHVDRTASAAPYALEERSWYPNGELLGTRTTDPYTGGTAASWRLLDAEAGVRLLRRYTPEVGGVEFVTAYDRCGFGASCGVGAAGAHGAAAVTTAPDGLATVVGFDELGRPVSTHVDRGGPSPGVPTLPTLLWSYERPVRTGAEGDPDAAGLPGTATRSNLVDDVAGTYVDRVDFLDGDGEVLLSRTLTEVADPLQPQAAVLGQRVEGRVVKDERGRPVAAFEPCFAPSIWTSAQDFVASPGAWGCAELRAQTRTFDGLDREVLAVRPDGSRVETTRAHAAAPLPGLVTREVLRDAGGATLQERETLASARERRTYRFGAVTHRRTGGSGSVNLGRVLDASVLETRERLDGKGRLESVWRTGLAAADGVEIAWNGRDLADAMRDPDRGSWEFEYDAWGRTTGRFLLDDTGLAVDSETRLRYDARGRLEESHFIPWAGGLEERWSHRYDQAVGSFLGLPTEPAAARGRATGSVYEAAGAAGLLVPEAEWAYAFDGMGRSAEVRQDLRPAAWGGTNPVEVLAGGFEYYPDGTVKRTLYPEAFTAGGSPLPMAFESPIVEVVRSQTGLPEAVEAVGTTLGGAAFTSYVAGATYDVHGRPAHLELGNGTEQTFQYQRVDGSGTAPGNLALEWTQVSGPSATLLERSYTWNAAGELQAWEDLTGAPEVGTCSYDGVGALLACAVSSSGGASSYAYEYDVLGNLIHESVGDATGGRSFEQLFAGDRGLLAAAPGVYRAPVNAPVAQLRTAAGAATVTADHAFDPRGSMVRQEWSVNPGAATFAADERGVASASGVSILAARELTWSGDAKLKEVLASQGGAYESKALFWYGPDGSRAAKSVEDIASGTTTITQRFGAFFEWVEDGVGSESWTLPIFLGDRIVAQHDVELTSGTYAEAVRWVAGDHLGSASVVTDELGDLRVGRKYEPYGREREAWGPDAAQGELDPGSVERRFSGKQRELDAMGLTGTPYELEGYDYGARYYLPGFAAWMTADSITPDNVGEFNAFQYVASNPLSYRDPTGHSVLTKVLKLIAKGGDIGATLYDLKVALDTLLDSNASWVDRGGAFLTLASELGPVSIGDLKDAGRAINAIDAKIDAARAARAADALGSGAKTVAGRGGSSARKIEKSNDARKAADSGAGDPEYVYRSGSRTDKNMTPRPDKDTDGLSTWTSLDQAVPPGGKAQRIETAKLEKVCLDCRPDGHVALHAGTPEETARWAATRDLDEAHELTKELQAASTEVRRAR